MDILTGLNNRSSYSTFKLQLIIIAWVMSSMFRRRKKISEETGDVSEDDYTKQSIYALLYSVYRAVGVVRSDLDEPYEFTFNTWGYQWPSEWGEAPTAERDPQRFGKNAYSGLFQFQPVKELVRNRDGRVHVVEMGCGTGAGAHHVCSEVLPKCTYEAVDMQLAAVQTARRKFVSELGDRLVATHANAAEQNTDDDEPADIIVICETHVTEQSGQVTPEDEAFFRSVKRRLRPGGFLVWGNAIPDSTWQPCFDFIESIGMSVTEVRDVTPQAVGARDADKARVNAYVQSCFDKFVGFRIPFLGKRVRRDTELAMKNFYRHPGTNLYDTMIDGTDSYRVVLVSKPPAAESEVAQIESLRRAG